MSLSLNEVAAQARKAARGAGYSWGMAEEAGRAARWLCAQGLDGCGLLLAALRRADTGGPGACPLAAGVMLSDGAAALSTASLAYRSVVAPALILPFAAGAAQALDRPVTVAWEGVEAVTDGTALSLAASGDAVLSGATDVTIRQGGTFAAPRAVCGRATPEPETWVALTALAERTHAPVTDGSRLRGAGAGLSDND